MGWLTIVINLYPVSVAVAVIVSALLPLAENEKSATGSYSLLKEMSWTLLRRSFAWPWVLYRWVDSRT